MRLNTVLELLLERKRILAREAARRYYGRRPGKTCELCQSSQNVRAHHDNYDKPLDIRWLCAKHHHKYQGHAITLDREMIHVAAWYKQLLR